jgi:hypothetical protein
LSDQAALHSHLLSAPQSDRAIVGIDASARHPQPAHERFADFKDAVLTFRCTEVPRRWDHLCDQVTDNFRVITPQNFRVVA